MTDKEIIATMPNIIPLSYAETQFDRRVNNLIGAYNNAQHLGMKCMWRDKVLELSKNIANDTETRNQILEKT
jgi:hypothetical protein